MKKISILFMLAAGLFTMIACEESGTGPVVSDTPSAPSISYPASGANLVMTKPLAENKFAFTWSAADYGMPLGILYTVQIDKAGNNFASPVNVTGVYALTDTLKYSEFNAKMVALEATMEAVNAIQVRVRGTIPNSYADTVFSAPISMNVTPYTAKDNLYMVGAFNGWNSGAAPAMNRNLPGLKYELYVFFPAGNNQFKLLPILGSWDGDIGDDASTTGKLIANGEQNMWVWPDDAMYRVNVDLAAMTWSTLKTTWGIIGGFGADGNNWASDYASLTYNPATNVLEATFTTSAACAFKFRANASWDLNFGDSGADGILDAGGSDISITSAGTYKVTLNLNPTGNPQGYTYTLTKL